MNEPAAAPSYRRIKPRVWIASSPRVAWKGAIRPWLEQEIDDAWKRPLPTVVVVPNASHANELKSRLLEDGRSYLGLHFLTPAGVRNLLASDGDASYAAWPELHLLLAVAAEEIAQKCDGVELLVARAITRAPDNLLRTLDRLEAAGWDLADLQFSAFRGIITRFREHLRACDFDLPARVDRAIASRASEQRPKIAALLMAGFNGAHWPLWPMLRAAVAATVEPTVILQDPRDEARDLDETWVGSWEEMCGEAMPVQSSVPRSETLFPELFEPELLLARGSFAVAASDTHFLVGRTVTEQAKAVAALAQRFLAGSNTGRVGILFPGPGALARTVAALLSEAGIPHYDGIAHLAPGPFEQEAWFAWLALQENPRLRMLLRFLRACPAAADLFVGLGIDRIEDILRRSHRDLLIDDLHLLRAYCANHSKRDGAEAAARGLETIRFLPAQATLPGFLAATRETFELFGWHERRAFLEQASLGWSGRIEAPFSRSTFLRWLADATASLLPLRSRQGDHPYSPVQLLLYPHP